MRLNRIAILLVLALSARGAVGIPFSTVAELRAASCCASSCVDVLRASRCCCHLANTDDFPLKQVVPSGQHYGAIGLPSRVSDVRCPARLTTSRPLTADATGPPAYLRLRTLQC